MKTFQKMQDWLSWSPLIWEGCSVSSLYDLCMAGRSLQPFDISTFEEVIRSAEKASQSILINKNSCENAAAVNEKPFSYVLKVSTCWQALVWCCLDNGCFRLMASLFWLWCSLFLGVPHTTHKGSGIVFTLIFNTGPEHRFCLLSGNNSVAGHMYGKITCRHHVAYELPKGGVAIVCLNHSACYLP